MFNRRGPNSRKVLMIIVGIVVLIVLVFVGSFVSKGKSEESNDDIDMNEPTKVAIEQKIEYGDDIQDKTFTVHTEDGTKEANFADLDPEIDTMTIGKTEHKLKLEDETFDVTVVVEDTKKPVIKGVKDVIELEGEEVSVEKELKKLITAEDPVDGELDVVFESEEDKDNENSYNVMAEATDENGNKTTEGFEVVVKVVVKEEKEEKADKKDVANKSSSVVSKSENDTSKPKQEEAKKETPKQEKPKQEKPKQEEPKQEKPKQEKPKQEKPKEEKPKQEEYQCSGVIGPGDPPPNFPPLNDPKGPLPNGASLINKEKSYHYYSYNRTLPGGGSISIATVSYGMCYLSVIIDGKDNNGKIFGSEYLIDEDKVLHTYIVEKPEFTNDDISVLFEVGRAFAEAYGM